MQGTFGGETFTFSLFLVLCNRLTTMCVALSMLLVSGRRSSPAHSSATAAGSGLHSLCRRVACLAHSAAEASRCAARCAAVPPTSRRGPTTPCMARTLMPTKPNPASPARADVRPGPAPRGAPLQLRRRVCVQRGGHLLPVRGTEARQLPHAGAWLGGGREGAGRGPVDCGQGAGRWVDWMQQQHAATPAACGAAAAWWHAAAGSTCSPRSLCLWGPPTRPVTCQSPAPVLAPHGADAG